MIDHRNTDREAYLITVTLDHDDARRTYSDAFYNLSPSWVRIFTSVSGRETVTMFPSESVVEVVATRRDRSQSSGRTFPEEVAASS